MTLWPQNYWDADAESIGRRSQKLSPEEQGEETEAQTIIKLILAHNGIKLRAVVVLKGKNKRRDAWDIPGYEGRWYECGDEKVQVPDLKARFF